MGAIGSDPVSVSQVKVHNSVLTVHLRAPLLVFCITRASISTSLHPCGEINSQWLRVRGKWKCPALHDNCNTLPSSGTVGVKNTLKYYKSKFATYYGRGLETQIKFFFKSDFFFSEFGLESQNLDLFAQNVLFILRITKFVISEFRLEPLNFCFNCEIQAFSQN